MAGRVNCLPCGFDESSYGLWTHCKALIFNSLSGSHRSHLIAETHGAWFNSQQRRMNVPHPRPLQDMTDVIFADTAGGDDPNAPGRCLIHTPNGPNSLQGAPRCAGGQNAITSGLHNRLERTVKITSHIECAVKGNAQGMCKMNQLRRPTAVDIPIDIKNADRNSISVKLLGQQEVATHDV